MSKTETQSEALRLAHEFEICEDCCINPSIIDAAAAAVELRRLDARVKSLGSENKAHKADVMSFHYAMKDAGWHPGRTDDLLTDIIRAKGEEMKRMDAENKALRERLEIDPSHPIDGIETRDETIRQLEEMVKSAAAAERERICEAIKTEDDYCVTEGDYMLDSDDCIKVARGEWVRPVYEVEPAPQAAAKNGGAA